METDGISASSKFDFSSGSPDRSLHASGLRGSYGAVSLDRSASFRENMENQLLSNLPTVSRSSSSITQGDVLNFFQCVRFDPKSMVVEHKLNRPAEFNRLASSAVGIPHEDSLPAQAKGKKLSSSLPENLRRLKSGVRESGTKARERVKILNDCLSVINKCFPTIPTRKRSRLDALSYDRPYSSMPIDHSGPGMEIGKSGSQNHPFTSGFEQERQNSKEWTRNPTPNKRPRTSMMDVRTNPAGRLSGALDEEKDRDVVRLNCSAMQSGEQALSIAVDGWEKTKMKKKRTGIKPGIATGLMTTRPIDEYNEPKQGVQPQLSNEARPRLTGSHSFRLGCRSGIINGGGGVRKTEVPLQSSSGMRPSISRPEPENNSLLHKRRERPYGQEKERVNLKPANKVNSEDLSSGSPTSGSNLNANVRAPRSGSVSGVSKLLPVVQRSTTSNDWELSTCTNKLPIVLGANSRKRTPSVRSPSPGTNWVQRPKKISRTARRTNLSPIVPSNGDNLVLDPTSDVMVNERCLPAQSPEQAKLKSKSFSPATLSESEEFSTADIKSNKVKKPDELGEKMGQNVQKISTLLSSPRKSKADSGDEHGDGVRRQGRTGRVHSSSRSLLPLGVEKLGNVGTTKQIRSSRLGLDKTERPGRPPTRRLSDRKAYTRQKHITINTPADSLVGSDDGHEELLAAANAVANTDQALSSPFWKKVEPLFRYISDQDVSYLKDQVDMPAAAPLDANSSTLVPSGYRSIEFGREESDTRSFEFSPEHLAPGAKAPHEISLFQGLLAAFISDEVYEESCSSGKDNPTYDVYGSRFPVGKDIESVGFYHLASQNCDLYPSSNGYGVNINVKTFYGLDHFMPENEIVSMPHDHLQNGSPMVQVIPGTACSDYHYSNMSINERLLAEFHSIGIFPDSVPDLTQNGDEDVSGSISRWEEKLQEQVSKKKSLLDNLLSCASEAKTLQEKEFEGRALDKLVEMAYEKYMSFWGPTTHGVKSASGKMAKQATLAFVKRVLERRQEFEVTGKSCFGEYEDMFRYAVSHHVDGQFMNSCIDNGHERILLSKSGHSVEFRTSVPAGSQQSPSANQETYFEALLSGNSGSKQNTGKDDTWSNRVKRRELFLDDVDAICSSRGGPTGLDGSVSCSAKGRRSERDREGKGNSREVLSGSGTTKIGRPASANVKGERRSKAKSKQKTMQVSASVNDSSRQMSGNSKLIPSPTIKSTDTSGSCKDKNENDLDMLEEPIDLSGLQLPGMDVLGAPDDFGGQGEDIGSWLNIEDDGLQDHDFMGGLEIPMDDLADLNMMEDPDAVIHSMYFPGRSLCSLMVKENDWLGDCLVNLATVFCQFAVKCLLDAAAVLVRRYLIPMNVLERPVF